MPPEAALTEVPEHLLARSRARRAAAGGGEASAPATTAESAPSVTESAAAPAVAAASAAPAKPAKAEPVLPWVEAAQRRHKIPVWAVSALVLLPIWAVVLATTNDPQSPKQAGPLTVGAETYSTCSSCHGSAGGGGVGPALSAGAVIKTFPEPGAQLRWVMLGTAGFTAEGTTTYGATKKPVGGGGNMPAQIALEATELLGVIRHEREVLGGETFDPEAWKTAAETLAADENPAVAAKAAEFAEIIESWAALPPGA